jgi:NAD(P)-dependent dehydrogenase (short-subunit alcohol dehydrogenase family)
MRRLLTNGIHCHMIAATSTTNGVDMKFTADAVPDLQGKTIVITGANSGIGLTAARVFVSRRARVVLACRDVAKMQAAAVELENIPGATVDQVQLDLSSLASVRAAAAELDRRYPAIDVLVNNAGIMAIPQRQTVDGFEMQVGTNHLGHFALTGLLLPQLQAAPAGRIVTVSSLVHHRGHVDLADLPMPRHYTPWRAYGMSKLANLLFAYELDRRLRAAGSRMASLACHPGYSATNLQAVGPKMSGSRAMAVLMRVTNVVMAQSPEMGALPTLYAATSPELQGGDYVGPRGFFGQRGYPVKTTSSAESHDVNLARQLWERSEELTGVHFNFRRAAA